MGKNLWTLVYKDSGQKTQVVGDLSGFRNEPLGGGAKPKSAVGRLF